MVNRYVHNVIFHEIVSPHRESPIGDGRFWMKQERFEAVLEVLTGREDVVITFDDGFRSDVSVALPELLSRGLKAKFFITVAQLGHPGFLRPQEVRTLADAGMTVGTHGFQHISWRTLGKDELVAEITQSRSILEDLIGRKVTELSMPSGQYNRGVLDILRGLRFDRVYTVDGPWARLDDWLQPRFPVTCLDTPETVEATLSLSRRGLGGVMRVGKQWIKQSRWW